MNKKKELFIPFDRFSMVGGPSTFMKNLRKYLDKKDYKYELNKKKGHGIFFPIAYDLGCVRRISEKKLPVIQRLDGVHYGSKHGTKYEELNREWKEIYNKYATFVVFQSEYSKKQCFEMFGKKKEEEYTIIVNGVDKEIFFPSSKNRSDEKKIKFVTTGVFRNIDMLEPVIMALDSITSELNFEFNIVGPVRNPLIEELLNRDYIVCHGNKNMEEIASVLRENDIYIYSHLNPPCPNSVLEAISCGLPVVGFNSGSMEELLYFSRELLANVNNEVFQKYQDFDYNKLTKKLLKAAGNLPEYKKLALKHSHLYSFEECSRKYLNVFSANANRYDGLKGLGAFWHELRYLCLDIINKIRKCCGFLKR